MRRVCFVRHLEIVLVHFMKHITVGDQIGQQSLSLLLMEMVVAGQGAECDRMFTCSNGLGLRREPGAILPCMSADSKNYQFEIQHIKLTIYGIAVPSTPG